MLRPPYAGSGRHNLAPPLWQALSTNKIDMSSTESSGAPAEGTATPPTDANSAPASTFGTSRGSGLARGKRPGSPVASAANAAPANADYKPTAIEIVQAPREYQNPFAPATPEPAPQAEAPAAPAAPVAQPVITPEANSSPAAPATAASTAPELFPLDERPSTPAGASEVEKAELNILPPERQKSSAPQTWESDSFRPAREPRGERGERPERGGRRDDRFGGERRERSEYNRERRGGEGRPENAPRGDRPERTDRPERAPREDRSSRPHSAPAATPIAEKPKGFFGWVKSLFGGSETEAPAKPNTGEGRQGGEHRGGQRHQRGGRGRGHGQHRGHGGNAGSGEQAGPGGEHRGGDFRGEGRGGDGFRRRRGGRGRGRGGFRGEGRGHSGPGDSNPQS